MMTRHAICLAAAAVMSLTPKALNAETTAGGQELSVKVRSAQVKSEPKFWSGAVTTVKYGDRITVVSSDGGWFKVSTKGGAKGYVHESAVTSKQVVLASNQSKLSSFNDQSEVVLAGKGFSQEAEKGLRSENTSLNFAAVDVMERQRVSNAELAGFIRSGKLGGQG